MRVIPERIVRVGVVSNGAFGDRVIYDSLEDDSSVGNSTDLVAIGGSSISVSEKRKSAWAFLPVKAPQ